MSRRSLPIFYACHRCPGYCCAYQRIRVTAGDLRRLAKYFDISAAAAERRFTRKGYEPGERVLRHQQDEIYGSICSFLDAKARRCTVYTARPAVCRQYPGSVRCGYYDFLSTERRLQEDPDFIPVTRNPWPVEEKNNPP